MSVKAPRERIRAGSGPWDVFDRRRRERARGRRSLSAAPAPRAGPVTTEVQVRTVTHTETRFVAPPRLPLYARPRAACWPTGLTLVGYHSWDAFAADVTAGTVVLSWRWRMLREGHSRAYEYSEAGRGEAKRGEGKGDILSLITLTGVGALRQVDVEVVRDAEREIETWLVAHAAVVAGLSASPAGPPR